MLGLLGHNDSPFQILQMIQNSQATQRMFDFQWSRKLYRRVFLLHIKLCVICIVRCLLRHNDSPLHKVLRLVYVGRCPKAVSRCWTPRGTMIAPSQILQTLGSQATRCMFRCSVIRDSYCSVVLLHSSRCVIHIGRCLPMLIPLWHHDNPLSDLADSGLSSYTRHA